MVKNVRGEELPFRNNRGKQAYYSKGPNTQLVVELISKGGSPHLAGKDTIIFDTIIPFCEEYGVTSALDVGAGLGRYAAWLYESGVKNVTAIEVSPIRASELEESLRAHNLTDITVKALDFESATPEEIGTWDLLFMSDIVEHFLDWPTAMQKAANLCKYCYMLIPGDRSWDWSPDHLTIFDMNEAEKLISIFKEKLLHKRLEYSDGKNWWHAIIVKGFIE